MAAQAWAPGLGDVARHIPRRTRDTRHPGSDRLLGTFTPDTTPSDGQAQQVIDDAVAVIAADVGDLATAGTDAQTAARVAAEWQAAADIEIAYPVRDADVQVAADLAARAAAALGTLKRALSQAGQGPVETVPEWSAPLPPPWADTSPGSGTDYVTGPW